MGHFVLTWFESPDAWAAHAPFRAGAGRKSVNAIYGEIIDLIPTAPENDETDGTLLVTTAVFVSAAAKREAKVADDASYIVTFLVVNSPSNIFSLCRRRRHCSPCTGSEAWEFLQCNSCIFSTAPPAFLSPPLRLRWALYERPRLSSWTQKTRSRFGRGAREH